VDNLIQETQPAKRKRGRPVGSEHRSKWLAARGIEALTAAEVIAWHGERKMWHRLLNSPDDRVCLQAWLNLVAWRDGKPSQQINVTSTQLTLNASDLEKARAIVAEIRGETSAVTPRLGKPSKVDCP
jgi:hypothetical protein